MGSVFGDADKSKSLLNVGDGLLDNIFGNDRSSILEKLIGMTGVKKAGGSMLFKLLAPIVMNKLAGMVFKNGWGAKKLSAYLGDQKSNIAGMLPGLGSMFAFADTSNSSSQASSYTEDKRDSDNGGGGWWKWLLPLLLIGALLWFLSKKGCNDGDRKMDNTEMTSPDHANTNYNVYNINDTGDVVDGDGNIVYRNGAYSLSADGDLVGDDGKSLIPEKYLPKTLLDKLKAFLGKFSGKKLRLDAYGNLVDTKGNVLFKKGDYSIKDGFYYDNDGNKLGRIWKNMASKMGDASDAMNEKGAIATDHANANYKKYGVNKAGDVVDADGNVVYSGGSYGLDAKGNLVDDTGKMLIPGTYIPMSFLDKLKAYLGKHSGQKLSLDAGGNLIDANGKVLYKKGSYVERDGFYYDNDGNKLGKIWAKIAKAIGDVAGKTLESMKNLFAEMVTKKEGAKPYYSLSDISFNKDDHRINNFSKAEVEGLAAALKENENGKIEVQVHTNDGATSKENKKLSKVRAEVVHNMLVTLGVKNSQISFKGMGDEVADKASKDKVEIVVK